MLEIEGDLMYKEFWRCLIGKNTSSSIKSNSERKSFLKFLSFIFIPIYLLLTIPNAIAQEILQNNTNYLPFMASSVIQTRLHNIDLMRNVLKQGKYKGYDIIIISSTTQEEADYQQQMLEKAFAGTFNQEGRRPIILSIVDSTEGGQLIGSVYTWLKAEEMMREKYADIMGGYQDLIDYVKSNTRKVAAFHNGGKGERCSPLTQSLSNSRGSQKLVGSIKNAQREELELDVILGVVLQCSSFAATNNGTHIDTFWTSQIAFGSNLHDLLVRSNFGLDKFLVGFDKSNLSAQNILDFGTAALTKKGRITAFYGNKRFALRKDNQYIVDAEKIEKELLGKGDRVAYDFGSFSVSFDMWQLLVDYWKKKNVFEPMIARGAHTQVKRDIDPHFIQPFIRFLYGMNDLADRNAIEEKLPPPSNLITQTDLNVALQNFDIIMNETMPQSRLYIWEDINNETDPKKKAEAIACMNEVMEFFLLYRQTSTFADPEKVFGFIDLGDDTQWFRYRRPIDIMNEKFEMLTDLIGRKIETQLHGSVQECEARETFFQRSSEARLMRGITDNEISKFTVDGKTVTMTFSELKDGKTVEDVYVKNSIVRNSDLTRGSSIVNSVVNHVTGMVIANNSYLESSTSPLIEARTSVVHQVIDIKQIKAHCEVVSDVYKSKVIPAYHGRMRAPIGYDAKGMPIYKIVGKAENGTLIYSDEFDETIRYFVERIPYDLRGAKEYSDKTARTEDGRFTFEEIREIEPFRMGDKNFRESIDMIAKKAVIDSRHDLPSWLHSILPVIKQ